ncbi:MAG: anti-sigma factor [Bryobacteraceae bacterium]
MNECEGLGQEIYDLYVLDLLERPMSQLVKAHLESGCPNCQKAASQGLGLWTGMALSAAQGSDTRPNAALKRRIMKSVEPVRATWVEWFFLRETWAAAAMAVVVAGSALWFFTHGGGTTPAPPALTAQAPVRPQPQVATAPPAEVPQVKPPAPMPPDVPPAGELAALRAKIGELERNLSAAAASAGQSETALRSEREQIQGLEAELGRQKTTLDAALQQRQQLEADLRRVQSQPAERGQPDRVAAQRVQFLEEENGRLRRDLTVLRQRADQGLQLAAFLASPDVRLVKLRGTEGGGKATGQVLISGGGRILLFTGDLPALPAGREYQLWMLRSSGPAIVSAGVFRSSDRKAEFQVADPALLNSLTSFAVTEEPAGGSPKPTGHKLLIGLAKS